MDVGLGYTYTSLAFPRYHYLQIRLQKLIPRWQNILDAGGLPDCISQGTIKLKEISSAAQHVTDSVAVNLFADAALLKKGGFGLPEQSITIGKVKVEDLQWTGYIKDLKKTSSFQPSVTVIVTQSEEKVHKVLEEFSEPQLMNVIIFNDQTKTCNLYTDLDNTDLDSKSAARSKSLTAQVQYLLEEKVITVLEMVSSYIREFIPRQEEELDSSLLDSIHMKLIESLRSPHVVKDLSPQSEEISAVWSPKDKEIHQIAEVIDHHWDGLAVLLGMTQLEIEHIKMENPTATHASIQMLRTWIQKKGRKAMLTDLFKSMEGMKMDTSVLKTSFEGPKTDVEKDEIFHKKLTDFVTKKTKCVACDILSKRYGISASLINEFLNAGFFGYETQVKELLGTIHMPKWPRDKSDNGVSTCRVFSYRCAMSMTKVIHSTEDYIKAKLKILTVMKKMQFEIFGLLLQTDVKVHTVIPEPPKLPLELQYELLEFPEVHGCGTCFGELVLHVRKDLYPARREEIRQLLMRYHYTQGFKSELMEVNQKTEQAKGLLLEQGLELRAKRQGGPGHLFGSIGCFVHMKPKCENVLGQNMTKAGAKVSTAFVITEEKVHCLTCAHCVRQCEDQVEVGKGGKYSVIGEKKVELYQPEAFDVASVQIKDDILADCDSKLRNLKGHIVNNWTIYQGDPLILRHVQKQGSATGFTNGIIMCTNYITEAIKELNITRRVEREPGRFSDSYNILIESLPGSEEFEPVLSGAVAETAEVEPFSREGDSGSVICADVIGDTDSVYAVALLIGAVGRENQGDRGFLYSYSSHMKHTLDEIQEQYDCTITPADLPQRQPAQAAGGAEGSGVVRGGDTLMMAQIGGAVSDVIYQRRGGAGNTEADGGAHGSA